MMTNKYNPLIICPKCSKEILDYDEEIDTITCSFYKCKTEIKKQLHTLKGSLISKGKNGRYILEFPEYKEKDIFPTWELLGQEIDRLARNE